MARRNHLAFIIAGLLLLIANLLLLKWETGLLPLFMTLVAISLVLFGIAKYYEPQVSFTLSPECLQWHLKYGDVKIPWDDIVDLTGLKVNTKRGDSELHYIGLKLWQLDNVVNSIPLRSAKSLFHEYRSLLHVALVEAQFRQDDVSKIQEDNDSWRSQSGKKIGGIKGMFASRLVTLKHYLGADLYFPITSLDRNQDDFIQMFRQYKRQIDAARADANQ
ncbi:MAG: DUF2982 domain-containing protein [Kangiellaceae bacterium]|jgi:hypothetical protein|nr:DUF2982 domain-containing protein [Kangiellaceae bacterium]